MVVCCHACLQQGNSKYLSSPRGGCNCPAIDGGDIRQEAVICDNVYRELHHLFKGS